MRTLIKCFKMVWLYLISALDILFETSCNVKANIYMISNEKKRLRILFKSNKPGGYIHSSILKKVKTFFYFGHFFCPTFHMTLLLAELLKLSLLLKLNFSVYFALCNFSN